MRRRKKADLLNKYKIFETAEFQKKLSKITSKQKILIQNKLKDYIYPQLRNEPYYGLNIKKLVGYKPEIRRYRLGSFRIFYSLNQKEKTIYILSIDQRKDAY